MPLIEVSAFTVSVLKVHAISELLFLPSECAFSRPCLLLSCAGWVPVLIYAMLLGRQVIANDRLGRKGTGYVCYPC